MEAMAALVVIDALLAQQSRVMSRRMLPPLKKAVPVDPAAVVAHKNGV